MSTCPTVVDDGGQAVWGRMPTYTKPLVSLDEASSCGLWLHDNLGSNASDTQGLTSDTSTNSDGLPKPEQGVFEVLQCTRDRKSVV